jgi:hypothetical protein
VARVVFTQNIQRHLVCPPAEVKATTVREALDEVFAENHVARSYVLDDQGGLRPHMAIFVDGEIIRDRRGLSDALEAGSEICIMQALSGG